MRFGFSRLAFPLYDEDGGGGSVAAADAPAGEPSESLSDHEAAYGPGAERVEPAAEPAADADAAAERDETGRFKPRHRAKSQQASAEDVPRINELTRKLREAEERASAAERRAAERAEPAAPKPDAPKPAKPAAAKFPNYEEFAAMKGNEDATWDDYLDARADHRYDQRRAQEKAEEAETAAARTFQEAVTSYRDALPAAQKKYADFEDIVGAAPSVSKVIERAVIAVGPEAAYYLATHPEEAADLTADTLIDPTNPAFGAAVATMRRYLSTLVASTQRSTPSRTAAASTGSALALVSPTPKPPNPVRTGAMKDADAPPGDESSLAEHEKAYAPKSRRA